MMIDAHAHIWGPDLDSKANRDMIEACRRYGIDKILISALFGGYGPDEENIELANTYLAKFIDQYPDLVRGMVYLNPHHKNSVDVKVKLICISFLILYSFLQVLLHDMFLIFYILLF